MSRKLGTLLATIVAMTLPAQASAQETVKVGQETKRAFGTIVALNAGDTACHLKLKDDRGAAFEEMARFEICEQRALLGKRVALAYVQQAVMSPDCQGDPACRKTRTAAPRWCRFAPPSLPVPIGATCNIASARRIPRNRLR
jgi:hypothetical protein